MTQGFALRRKILPPLKFCDTNQRFGRKNPLKFYDTKRGKQRGINPTLLYVIKRCDT